MPAPLLPLTAIRQPAFLYGPDHTIVDANDLAEAMAGRSLIGCSSEDVARIFRARHPDGTPLAQVELRLSPALAGEDVLEVPLAVTDVDGRTLAVLATASPVRDGDAVTGALVLWQDVTERNRTELALRASEDQFRTAFEATPLGMILGSADGRILSSNPAVERMLGYTADELRGMSFAEITHPADLLLELPLVEKVLAGETDRYEIEIRYIRKDGRSIWVRLIGTPIRDRDGAPTMAIAIVEDITAKREAEQAFAEQHELLERLIETVPVMISIHDPALGQFHLNRAVEETIGYTDADAADGRLLERTYPDPAYRTKVEAYMRSLEPGWRDMTVTAKDGSAVPTSWANFRLSNAVEVGVGIDLRERTRMEAALRKSEERLRDVLELSLDAVYRFDIVAGRFDYVSPAIEQITGLLAEEFAALRVEEVIDLVHPDDRATVAAVFEKGLENHSGTIEYRLRGRGGGYRWLADHFLVQVDEDGRPWFITGVVRDVTRRREDEEALKRFADDLQRSNEELQRFAYVASHDLQEPLRSIVSFSQLLERRYKGKLDPDADEYIGFIVEGGTRMQTLIQDLLQVSRVETGAKPLEPTDPHAVVSGALRALEAPIREAGASMTVEEALPAVMADWSQLEQVFVNLVGNAIKYRHPDRRLAVRISAERRDGMVEFSVADNGIGIEAEYFDRIFEMFRRLHTHDEYEGTGIGLAVVKRIVERHGGTIRVESTPGEGSTFFFTLPAA